MVLEIDKYNTRHLTWNKALRDEHVILRGVHAQQLRVAVNCLYCAYFAAGRPEYGP